MATLAEFPLSGSTLASASVILQTPYSISVVSSVQTLTPSLRLLLPPWPSNRQNCIRHNLSKKPCFQLRGDCWHHVPGTIGVSVKRKRATAGARKRPALPSAALAPRSIGIHPAPLMQSMGTMHFATMVPTTMMLSESGTRQPQHQMVQMNPPTQVNTQQHVDQQQVSHTQAVSHNQYHSHAALGLPVGCPIPQMSIHGPTPMGQVSMGAGTIRGHLHDHAHAFGGYDPRMIAGGGEGPLSMMYPETRMPGMPLPMMVPSAMIPGVMPTGMSHNAYPAAVMVQAQLFHPWAQGPAYRYQDRAGFDDPRGHAPPAPPLEGAISDAWTSLHHAAEILTRSNAHTGHTVQREWRKHGVENLDNPTKSQHYSKVIFGSNTASDTPLQPNTRKGGGTQESPTSPSMPAKMRRIGSDGRVCPTQSSSRVLPVHGSVRSASAHSGRVDVRSVQPQVDN
jgi:hypothetical protein